MARTEPQGRTRSVRQVVAASFIGTTIEWYDFFLYGTAAALVFNKLFFPEAEPSSGTLLALATYGVGFAARPLGGIIFGHFGDRIGRKAMLVLSLLIMGVATFLIGAMPTYAQIGIWAPVILVLLIGHFLYHERLDRLQLAGSLAGVAAVLLLALGSAR